jgi:hypothetical protein
LRITRVGAQHHGIVTDGSARWVRSTERRSRFSAPNAAILRRGGQSSYDESGAPAAHFAVAMSLPRPARCFGQLRLRNACWQMIR